MKTRFYFLISGIPLLLLRIHLLILEMQFIILETDCFRYGKYLDVAKKNLQYIHIEFVILENIL